MTRLTSRTERDAMAVEGAKEKFITMSGITTKLTGGVHVEDYKKAIELNSVINNKSEIARTLNIDVATVHRYLSEGWEPFETKARYFSDFIKEKEWFYGI